MEGQAERQPLSTNDAASAIEALLGDDGALLDSMPAEESEGEQPEVEEAPDVEAKADQGSDQEEAETEPDQVTLETIDDVAQALGVDPNDLLANLKMRIKVNGEERLVSLKEAQTGQQLEADYRRKTSELAEQRRAIEQEQQQRAALFQQQMAESAAALQAAEQSLLAEFSTPAMQELRTRAPAEWTARIMEGQARMAALQQARQSAVTQWQQQQQTVAQEQQRQLQHLLATEQEALSTKLGNTWSGDTKQKLASFLMNEYGFSADDVGRVYNHRLILLALDAMKGKESAAKANEVKQKVKAAPPVMQKPGKPVSKVQVERNKLAALKSAARNSGKMRDAAAVIERLL